MLKDFIERFNERFGVPAQHAEAAYRPVGSGVCLDTALCFRHRRRVARDSTVKYRWRTLQLLPGMERPSYAGAVVEVMEGLDSQLTVSYQGEIIPSQEAPPRPGILRSFNGSSSHGPPPHGGLNGLGRRWETALAALDTEIDAGDADDTGVDNGTVRVRKAPAISSRKPTPLQTARWNAAQKAKRRGPDSPPDMVGSCLVCFQGVSGCRPGVTHDMIGHRTGSRVPSLRVSAAVRCQLWLFSGQRRHGRAWQLGRVAYARYGSAASANILCRALSSNSYEGWPRARRMINLLA